jgi:hypothetical protein
MYPPRRTRNTRHKGDHIREITRQLDIATSLTPDLTCCVFTMWVVWKRLFIIKKTRITINIVVYYDSMKRGRKTRPIYSYECRCDERLKTKAEEGISLTKANDEKKNQFSFITQFKSSHASNLLKHRMAVERHVERTIAVAETHMTS